MQNPARGPKLNTEQKNILLHWLAQQVPYPELRARMLAQWGIVISSPACTGYRKRYATQLEAQRAEIAKAQHRRDRDRWRKTKERARGTPHQHCATCRCFEVATAA